MKPPSLRITDSVHHVPKAVRNVIQLAVLNVLMDTRFKVTLVVTVLMVVLNALRPVVPFALKDTIHHKVNALNVDNSVNNVHLLDAKLAMLIMLFLLVGLIALNV